VLLLDARPLLNKLLHLLGRNLQFFLNGCKCLLQLNNFVWHVGHDRYSCAMSYVLMNRESGINCKETIGELQKLKLEIWFLRALKRKVK
jgi:hypothetical protein